MNILEAMEVVVVNKLLAQKLGLNKSLIASKIDEIVSKWNETEQFNVSLSALPNALYKEFPFFSYEQIRNIIEGLTLDDFFIPYPNNNTFDISSGVFDFYLGGE